MGTSHRDKKLLYHLTDVRNLPSIQELGLLSRRDVARRKLDYIDVADPEILEGREQHDLDAYVPFHFMVRNPFDYGVAHAHPSKRFCILAMWRTFAESNGWRIVPQHPLSYSDEPQVLSWKKGLAAIDWDQFDRDDRTYDDHDCKMTCMAEALSPKPVMLRDCAFLYFPTEKTFKEARALVGVDFAIKVNVMPQMFPPSCK